MATIQEQAQHHLSRIDKDKKPGIQAYRVYSILILLSQLSKYPLLNDFERQSGVPKVGAVLGLGAVYALLVFLNVGSGFLVNIVGFAIPGYYSLEALFSSSKTDDTQWLTYWVVYAGLTMAESLINAVYWFRKTRNVKTSSST